MNGTVLIKLISPKGKVLDKAVHIGRFTSVIFNSNSSVGTWKIVSQFDGLVNEREFKMKGVQKVSFNFEDAVLVVKNIGNIPYNKTIGITIGNKTETLNLKIGLGETRKFSLNAPTGKYNVVVGSGQDKLVRQILLTGNTIQINDFKSGWVIKNYSVVWIFLIIVLGGLGLVLFMRYRKTRVVGKKSKRISKLFNRIRGNNNVHKTERVFDKTNNIISEPISYTKRGQDFNKTNNYSQVKNGALYAESSLVLGGEKYMSSIVVLNIKNYNGLKDISRENIKDIIEDIKGKGIVDYRGDYVFILFNPLITKTYRNEILAVKSGVNILLRIKEHNKKFEDKIDFGIGVHNGELIANRHGNKFKYTGIGNSFLLQKNGLIRILGEL